MTEKITARQWERIGLGRRAGVATPLFSVYSSRSLGIGELPDLKLLVDWCRAAGLTILQLLPMNDVGFGFRPYDAQSGFALEPMYLSLADLIGVDAGPWSSGLRALRRRFPAGVSRVPGEVKEAKLHMLWEIYRKVGRGAAEPFEKFQRENGFWLEDYAIFKVIRENQNSAAWEGWEKGLASRDPGALRDFRSQHGERIRFHAWLQWQLFEQFRKVRRYAEARKVLLMGDIPLLVSRDSADVWAHQDYFKLGLASGAPPDAFHAKGQRWGMPPYDWARMADHQDDYWVRKLEYAAHFYDLFRLDHAVGVFRVWTLSKEEPVENQGLHGAFDPPDENVWEGHGRRILRVMALSSRMLPCAEDLGVVPECSSRVLEEFGIPGTDIQRWKKDWKKSYDFTPPRAYRKVSVAVISTHDLSSLPAWWEFEAGTVDREKFERMCRAKGIAFEEVSGRLFDPSRARHGRLRWREEISGVDRLLAVLGRPRQELEELVHEYLATYGEKERLWKLLGLEGKWEEKSSHRWVRRSLEKVNEAASIFSIQMLQDWVSLGRQRGRRALPSGDSLWDFRINFPGTLDERNWTLVMPWGLEELMDSPVTREIRELVEKSGRLA